MLTDFLNRVLQLQEPMTVDVGGKSYTNKGLTLIQPPLRASVELHTLQQPRTSPFFVLTTGG